MNILCASVHSIPCSSTLCAHQQIFPSLLLNSLAIIDSLKGKSKYQKIKIKETISSAVTRFERIWHFASGFKDYDVKV